MLGDVDALVAGTTAGCRRLEALVAEHGAALLAEGIDEHLDHTERLVRQEVAALADGTYTGGYVIDDDGIHAGVPLDVRVTVAIEGDQATIDFAGTSPNVPAAVNSSLSQTISGALFALRCPVRVEALDVIDGSGGAGRWNGGRGTRTTYLLLADAVATFRCDRHANPPPGRDGGEPGRRGGYFVVRPGGEPERLPDKAANVRLRAGDRFVIETSGGGGFGPVPCKNEEEQ
jgi:N-methylhydantoinase B/oxoprolinase/acetone carboxylase alpha subunit